jgi:ribA/ribD-fused uncharacterized protein
LNAGVAALGGHLCQRFVMAVNQFTGPFEFLSTFYPCVIVIDGETYNSVEHAFQAKKTDNPEHRRLIRLCKKAKEARALGRRIPMRETWDDEKIEVMRDLLRQKFSDPDLGGQLVATGRSELIHGNPYNQTFWGVCRGAGANWLGKLLMDVREELQK